MPEYIGRLAELCARLDELDMTIGLSSRDPHELLDLVRPDRMPFAVIGMDRTEGLGDPALVLCRTSRDVRAVLDRAERLELGLQVFDCSAHPDALALPPPDADTIRSALNGICSFAKRGTVPVLEGLFRPPLAPGDYWTIGTAWAANQRKCVHLTGHQTAWIAAHPADEEGHVASVYILAGHGHASDELSIALTEMLHTDLIKASGNPAWPPRI